METTKTELRIGGHEIWLEKLEKQRSKGMQKEVK